MMPCIFVSVVEAAIFVDQRDDSQFFQGGFQEFQATRLLAKQGLTTSSAFDPVAV
jgi:hypothetical protein